MKNFAQLTFELQSKEQKRKEIIGNTKLKAFEVNFEKPTERGVQKEQVFVRANSPKNALTTFRKKMAKSGQQFYEVFEIVAPNKIKGNVVYEVYKNKSIVR